MKKEDKKLKKEYLNPEVNIFVFKTLDVITTSNVIGDDNVGFTPKGKWGEFWN